MLDKLREKSLNCMKEVNTQLSEITWTISSPSDLTERKHFIVDCFQPNPRRKMGIFNRILKHLIISHFKIVHKNNHVLFNHIATKLFPQFCYSQS